MNVDRYNKSSTLFLLIWILLLFGSQKIYEEPLYQILNNHKNQYQLGLSEIKKGDWVKAINLWTNDLKKLNKEKKSNPRMAVKYIETVTEEKAYKYYKNASRFYLENLENAKWSDAPKILAQEIKRTLPIVPPRIHKLWEKQLKNKNPELFKEDVFYWNQMDPITTTKINERLIEHWERIDYARQHFTRNHTTVFGTDDRGLIYVKYGEPDKVIKEAVPFHGVTNPMTGMPIGAFGTEFNPEIPLVVNFELWTYQFSNRNEPSYYLFGQTKGAGRFKLQPGILSIIPSYGYSLAAVGIDSQGGQMMIRYGILQQIKGLSNYFGQLYENMTQDMIMSGLNGDNGLGVFNDPSIMYKYEEKEIVQSEKRDERSPASTDSIITANKYLPVQYNVYRFLGKKNQTEYYIVANPQIYLLGRRIKQLANKTNSRVSLRLKSTLFTFKNNGLRSDQENRTDDVIDNQIAHPVMFMLNADSIRAAVIMGMDLMDRNGYSSLNILENNNKSPLVGSSGPINVQLPNPLSEKNKVVISDPVIGHMQKINNKRRIPFYPTVGSIFYNNDQMLVYFEIYHLKTHHYSIEYSFDKFRGYTDRGRSRPYKAKAAATVEYQSFTPNDHHWFSIKLNDFKPGWYDLVMQVRIPGVKSKMVRKVPFLIERG